METKARAYWNEAARDENVRYKYIADKWAKTETFIEAIEKANTDWNKVLEIGCGIGRLLAPLSKKYPSCQFYGLDISDEMIKKAIKRKNIKYQEYDSELDLVYSMLVFQHIDTETKQEKLDFAYKNLKKGGVFLMQFVVGDENAPYSYQLQAPEMLAMIDETGFIVEEITTNFMHKQWCLVKARK